ncbi:MAG: alpha/beta fold hydrolase [Aquabacterium sp.]
MPSTTFDVLGPDGPLRAESWGQVGHPVVVLVHGYPDNRSEWRPIAQYLAARQYQVVAYDVRGAGESIKPKGRAAYRLDKLMADFKAVIDVVSPDRPVHLVGHDWGSVQAWEFATEPALKGRIASYVSCSGPCLDHAGFWLRSRLQSPRRSTSTSSRCRCSSPGMSTCSSCPGCPRRNGGCSSGANGRR